MTFNRMNQTSLSWILAYGSWKGTVYNFKQSSAKWVCFTSCNDPKFLHMASLQNGGCWFLPCAVFDKDVGSCSSSQPLQIVCLFIILHPCFAIHSSKFDRCTSTWCNRQQICLARRITTEQSFRPSLGAPYWPRLENHHPSWSIAFLCPFCL